jgi:hypothetical protein
MRFSYEEFSVRFLSAARLPADRNPQTLKARAIIIVPNQHHAAIYSAFINGWTAVAEALCRTLLRMKGAKLIPILLPNWLLMKRMCSASPACLPP